MSEAPEVLRFYDNELKRTLEFMTRGGNNKYVRADRIEELEAKLEKAVEALEFYTYETTHLSAEEDDGSHWCKISKGCLAQARTTLAELKGEK